MYYSTLYAQLMSDPQVTSSYGEQVLSWSSQRQIELGLYPAVTTTPVYNSFRQTTDGYVMTYYGPATPGYDASLGYSEYYLQEWIIIPLTGTALEYSTAGAITQYAVTDVRTLTATDAAIYGESTPPTASPTGVSGWYFKNSSALDNIEWLMYENASENSTQTFTSINSIWAVINFANTDSRPYLKIYSLPTGSGDENPAYHSVWQYDDYLVPPSSTGTYLVYWGNDPGMRLDLPRINITQVPGMETAGDLGELEVLKSFYWVTNYPGTPNDEEFTIQSCGYIINGKISVTTFIA